MLLTASCSPVAGYAQTFLLLLACVYKADTGSAMYEVLFSWWWPRSGRQANTSEPQIGTATAFSFTSERLDDVPEAYTE